MVDATLAVTLLQGLYAICRMGPDEAIPAWALEGDFFSITRTPGEVSVVVSQERVPKGTLHDSGWRCFRVEGPLPLCTIGVLASLTVPLSKASVSLFAVSTYDTDYLLVKEAAVERTAEALSQAGHTVRL